MKFNLKSFVKHSSLCPNKKRFNGCRRVGYTDTDTPGHTKYGIGSDYYVTWYYSWELKKWG